MSTVQEFSQKEVTDISGQVNGASPSFYTTVDDFSIGTSRLIGSPIKHDYISQPSHINQSEENWYSDEYRYCIDYAVKLKNGIHARPAGAIVTAMKDILTKSGKENVATDDIYVYLSKDHTEKAQADSIMSIMLLGVTRGSVLTISSDNKEAAKVIYNTIKSLENYL